MIQILAPKSQLLCATQRRSLQNVTAQAIKDRRWQISMCKCQSFGGCSCGIRWDSKATSSSRWRRRGLPLPGILENIMLWLLSWFLAATTGKSSRVSPKCQLRTTPACQSPWEVVTMVWHLLPAWIHRSPGSTLNLYNNACYLLLWCGDIEMLQFFMHSGELGAWVAIS